jgi:hypothetical protein
MNPTNDAGSGTQRLAEFQVQGNAAERYERWVVPFVVGPWVPALLDLAEVVVGSNFLGNSWVKSGQTRGRPLRRVDNVKHFRGGGQEPERPNRMRPPALNRCDASQFGGRRAASRATLRNCCTNAESSSRRHASPISRGQCQPRTVVCDRGTGRLAGVSACSRSGRQVGAEIGVNLVASERCLADNRREPRLVDGGGSRWR